MTEWWDLRPARSRKPATYRCPLCDEYLSAMSDHVLLKPEGDSARRRHAHLRCVVKARRAGRLRTRDEWRGESQPSGVGARARIRSVLRRLRSAGSAEASERK